MSTCTFQDIFQGLVKPLFFGIHHRQHRVLLRPEDHGRHAGRGTVDDQGGGTASVLIIFVDFLLSQVMVAMFSR